MTTHRLIQSTLFATSLSTVTLLSGCVIYIGQETMDTEITLEAKKL
jgi:hypothetical protein